MKDLAERFSSITDVAVSIIANDIPDDRGGASIIVAFANGASLRATYWRVINHRRRDLSSFDHEQKYGLPTRIDAKSALHKLLDGRLCRSVDFDSETADIIVNFAEGDRLQVFAFTGYEAWEIRFPDGTGEYSNYAIASLHPSE